MKPLKTNSKEVRNLIKAHILECMHDDSEKEFANLKDACNFLNKSFNDYATFKSNLSYQDLFNGYIMGSVFYFYFETHKIIDFLNSLGINPENKDFDSKKSANLYTYLIYSEMNKNL